MITLNNMITLKGIIKSFALGASLLIAPIVASAATVDFQFGGASIFTVDCATCNVGDIQGWVTTTEGAAWDTAGGAFSNTLGTAFNPVVGPEASRNPDLSGNSDYLNFVQTLSGDGALTQTGIDESASVPSIFGEYITFKAGDYAGLLKNTTGGNLTLTFTQVATGAGLSNVRQFGGTSGCTPPQILVNGVCVNPGGPGVVPLPAGLPLMLTVIGVGAYMRRRARKFA